MEAMNDTLLYDPNEPAILTCTARGGPSNTYTWFFNGALIANERTDTLSLSEVEGGSYVCQVSNTAGSGTANIVLTGKDSHSVMYIHYNHSNRHLKKVLHVVLEEVYSIANNFMYSFTKLKGFLPCTVVFPLHVL